MVRITDMASPS